MPPKSGRYPNKAEDSSALRGLEEKAGRGGGGGGEGDWGGKSNGLKKRRKEKKVFLYSGAPWKGHRTTAWRKWPPFLGRAVFSVREPLPKEHVKEETAILSVLSF